MNDLSKVPAAELVGEWKNPQEIREVIKKFRESTIPKTDALIQNIETWAKSAERMDLIAQELDRRCEGMQIIGGELEIDYTKIRVLSQLTVPPKPISVRVPVNATELRALLGWLLMKGGNP